MKMTNKIALLKSLLNDERGEIYLFGASVTGEKALQYFEKRGHQIAGFIDNNKNLNGQFFLNRPVHDGIWLKANFKEDDIVIISSHRYIAISEQLMNMGISSFLQFDERLLDFLLCVDVDQYENEYHYFNETIPAFEKSIQWILTHITKDGGVSYSNTNLEPYPEVSGYIVPTLVDYGYIQEGRGIVKWLLSIQQKDGGFLGPNGSKKEYVFDTAQILRGLLCYVEDSEIGKDVELAILKSCDYLCSQMINDGKGGYRIQYNEMKDVPEPILLYTLPPMKKVAELYSNEKLKYAVNNCLEYYLSHENFLNRNYITHFVVYMIEALIDLGREESVEEIMDLFKQKIVKKGYVEAKSGVDWICTPGMAQLALCWYKLDDNETADIAMNWVEKNQTFLGGFYGSYGVDATYLESEEIAWAVKFYLDANKLRIRRHFDQTADDKRVYPEEVGHDDCRYLFLKEYLMDGMNIAEIGCGKGRFLRNIKEDYNDITLIGVDISESMLSYLPQDIEGEIGELENIPLQNETYDLVFCIEALEHAINRKAALREMVRILKPNGRLIIVDKNKQCWGQIKCPSWEDWFNENEMIELLSEQLDDVNCSKLENDNNENDLLFLGWTGIKR